MLSILPAFVHAEDMQSDSISDEQFDAMIQRCYEELQPQIENIEITEIPSNDSSEQSSESDRRNTPSIIYSTAGFLREIDITYNSIDGRKRPARLSAKVYLPMGSYIYGLIPKVTISHVLLNCHPTVTSNFEAPTGLKPVDGDIKRMTGEDDFEWMVVCPDYCGYGVSSYLQHPYLIHDITARNCIDATLAAITLVKTGDIENYDSSMFGYSLQKDYTTDIVGYSQGGATALACTKYLEGNACSKDVKDMFKLRQTTCGDGPYSILATINQYLTWGRDNKELEYPCVLPLIVEAAKEAYNDGCMHSVEVKDYFTEQFLETGILDYLRSKTTSTTDLNSLIKDAMKETLLIPGNIFSKNMVDEKGYFNTTSNEYKCLMRAIEMADLTKGWEPHHPIYFFHLENDNVVPYANYEAIRDNLQHDYPDLVSFVPVAEAHNMIDLGHDDGDTPSFLDYLNPVSLNMSIISGFFDFSLGFISVYKGVAFPDYDSFNHSTGGTLFYIDYMFGSKLRHNY